MHTATPPTRTAAVRPPRARLHVVAAVIALIALLVPVTAARATTGEAQVDVHFTPAGSECDVTNAYTRTVATPAVLTGALTELLEGPTAQEAPATATSFSDATAGMLRSVAIRDGVAHVDLHDLRQVIPNASTACGSASLLSQLDATATQFPTVQRARYSINGSEATFYHWLQRPVPGTSTVTTTRGTLDNTSAIRRRYGGEATLRAMRVGRHDGFDRIAFEFDGERPAYNIRYVDVARMGGSGFPIRTGGDAAMQIDLGAHTVDMGDPAFPLTFAPTVLRPRYPTLRTVRYGGEFEALATFGVGLSQRTGFRVLELANPTRLAIDVAHR